MYVYIYVCNTQYAVLVSLHVLIFINISPEIKQANRVSY